MLVFHYVSPFPCVLHIYRNFLCFVYTYLPTANRRTPPILNCPRIDSTDSMRSYKFFANHLPNNPYVFQVIMNMVTKTNNWNVFNSIIAKNNNLQSHWDKKNLVHKNVMLYQESVYFAAIFFLKSSNKDLKLSSGLPFASSYPGAVFFMFSNHLTTFL